MSFRPFPASGSWLRRYRASGEVARGKKNPTGRLGRIGFGMPGEYYRLLSLPLNSDAISLPRFCPLLLWYDWASCQPFRAAPAEICNRYTLDRRVGQDVGMVFGRCAWSCVPARDRRDVETENFSENWRDRPTEPRLAPFECPRGVDPGSGTVLSTPRPVPTPFLTLLHRQGYQGLSVVTW